MDYFKKLEETPYVISLIHPKGGPGKTTVCINLAHGLVKRGFNVLVVDTDALGVIRQWYIWGDGCCGFEVIGSVATKEIDRINELKDLPKELKQRYDRGNKKHIVIIDGAGTLERITSVAVELSDLVIIPVVPGPFEISCGPKDLIKIIEKTQTLNNGKPKCTFLVNKVIKNTLLAKGIRESLSVYNTSLLDTQISHSVAYPTAFISGESIFSQGESLIGAEFSTLIEEILARYIYREF